MRSTLKKLLAGVVATLPVAALAAAPETHPASAAGRPTVPKVIVGGANPVPWKALAASGSVEARQQEAWSPVRRGDLLQTRTTLRTGRQGRATLGRSADILIVDPGSRIELPDTAAMTKQTPIVQQSGSVIYEVNGRAHRDFRVQTPYLVAGVKGTLFLVNVTDRHAAVTVQEGTVEITGRSGQIVELRPGETLFVDAADPDSMQLVSRDRHLDGHRLPSGRARDVAQSGHRRLEKDAEDRGRDQRQTERREQARTNEHGDAPQAEERSRDALGFASDHDGAGFVPTRDLSGRDHLEKETRRQAAEPSDSPSTRPPGTGPQPPTDPPVSDPQPPRRKTGASFDMPITDPPDPGSSSDGGNDGLRLRNPARDLSTDRLGVRLSPSDPIRDSMDDLASPDPTIGIQPPIDDPFGAERPDGMTRVIGFPGTVIPVNDYPITAPPGGPGPGEPDDAMIKAIQRPTP